jgi:hypothetical protein
MCNRRVFSERELVELGKSDTADGFLCLFALSAHLEYDLAEVAASFEVALRCPRFCQGKTPIYDHLKFFFLDEVEEVSQLAEVLWFRLEIVCDGEAARLAPIG